jgi:transketolase
MAVGIALGMKIKKVPGRVFCLVGDGECNEGSIWESCLLTSHRNLNNLTCIVDYNHSTDRAINMESLSAKFSSFGFSVDWICGHNHADLADVLSVTNDCPRAIIAETVKGYGCKRMEGNPAWHHRVPTEAEVAEMIEEICGNSL